MHPFTPSTLELDYRLIRVSADGTDVIHEFHRWDLSEEHRSHHTCRPVADVPSLEQFQAKISAQVNEGVKRIFVLVEAGSPEIPLGRIDAGDFNPRNRSAEFGYYLPPERRGQGLGRIMATLFLDRMFGDDELGLHKLYATASSGNAPSVGLLKSLGFRLDGRMREHYWIDGQFFDQAVYSMLRREWEVLARGAEPDQDKVIGILGGMGPEATVDLFGKIVAATPIRTEQDHLRIIVDNNPKMPSRLDCVLRGGPSPVPAMQETARNLERAGADLIVIGANTAHYFYPDVQAAVGVPVIHMIEETSQATAKQWPDVKKVGLLATTGTVKTRMYHEAYARMGVEVVAPTDADQEQMMAAILSFKEGGDVAAARKTMTAVAERLVQGGAEAVLLGCTEVPIILNGVRLGVPVIDAGEIVAEAVVKRAKSL